MREETEKDAIFECREAGGATCRGSLRINHWYKTGILRGNCYAKTGLVE